LQDIINLCLAREDPPDEVIRRVDELLKEAQGAIEATPMPAQISQAGGINAVPETIELAVDLPPPGWPRPLEPETYHGCAGRIVQALAPHTEADQSAILAQLLISFGNLIGRSAHFSIDGAEHYTNLFAVLVGRSSRARKGTSWVRTRRVLSSVDDDWVRTRIESGLSSGEGLITAVRDPDLSNSDIGVADKRLLVQEPEFANVLKNADRQGNTLSVVLRRAWDDGSLQVLTRTATKATGAHISVIGHITLEELKRCLSATEQANGFANRFLWVCARRSKLLPLGSGSTEDLRYEIQQLSKVAEIARSIGKMEFDHDAREMWIDAYPQLSRERPGLLGAVTNRSEAQTLRLACIFALLDGSATIGVRHLAAGLEVWRYCEDSAGFIFGGVAGDSTADEILSRLKSFPEGLTRDEIGRVVFARRKNSGEVSRALDALEWDGRIISCTEPTKGRSATRYRLHEFARKAR
jgi:hypothetical protein